MSSNKKVDDVPGPPDNMATPIVKLRELGFLIAQEHKLPAGHYELVIEYKFGAGRLQDEDGGAIGAMALTFGGLGLRAAAKASPMTIEVAEGRSGSSLKGKAGKDSPGRTKKTATLKKDSKKISQKKR